MLKVNDSDHSVDGDEGSYVVEGFIFILHAFGLGPPVHHLDSV